MKNKTIIAVIFITFVLFLSSCSSYRDEQINREYTKHKIIEEADILPISLSGPISNRKSEISGLCWYMDKLILLPQYPNQFNNESGIIFFIDESRIMDFISGKDTSAILPETLKIDLSNIEDMFSLGSGFESITTNGDTVYFTIESMNQGETESILVSGTIDYENRKVILDENSFVKDPSEIFIYNISDESILFHNKTIIPIYEVFGKNMNTNPRVSVFNSNLQFQRKINFPTIEYRITDVTSVDHLGRFWAINYFYPGDNYKLSPAEDQLVYNYGIGKSHLISDPVERLVEFQINEDKISIVNNSPIYLELLQNDSRNWEGIARFGDGFLIATDTFPETIFAYVKVKNQ